MKFGLSFAKLYTSSASGQIHYQLCMGRMWRRDRVAPLHLQESRSCWYFSNGFKSIENEAL